MKLGFFSVLAGVVALASVGDAEAQYYDRGGYGEVVRCESRDYRQIYCEIDARNGVRIINQLSDTACIEGRTWGWDRRGVWVSGGCRAEFESSGGYGGSGYGYDGGYGGDVVRCESRGYAQVYCNADTRSGVRLVNQLSSTACIEGQTWGADRRGLWVRGGCRGEFQLGGGYGGGGYGQGLPIEESYGNTVRCESRDNRYRHCATFIRREARLVRQLSGSQCIYNASWGFDRNGIWVDRGCRGEFSIF